MNLPSFQEQYGTRTIRARTNTFARFNAYFIIDKNRSVLPPSRMLVGVTHGLPTVLYSEGLIHVERQVGFAISDGGLDLTPDRFYAVPHGVYVFEGEPTYVREEGGSPFAVCRYTPSIRESGVEEYKRFAKFAYYDTGERVWDD